MTSEHTHKNTFSLCSTCDST